MFPTPCDLLSDLALRDRNAAQSTPTVGQSHGDQSDEQTTDDNAKSSKSKARNSARKLKQPGEPKPENQRKAYFRSVAINVCFQPTDP